MRRRRRQDRRGRTLIIEITAVIFVFLAGFLTGMFVEQEEAEEPPGFSESFFVVESQGVLSVGDANFGQVFIVEDRQREGGTIRVYASKFRPNQIGCPDSYRFLDVNENHFNPRVREAGYHVCQPLNIQALQGVALQNAWAHHVADSLGVNMVYRRLFVLPEP